MNRKLYKNELKLWKEVTKDDIKINDYLSEKSLENNQNKFEKTHNIKKEAIINDIDIYKNKIKRENSNHQKLQVNKRMKSKFERGLIRPEAFLDLHGYNRVDAEKTLEDFIKTCIYKEKRCILIVTGKKISMLGSKSVLRELVPQWLNENKYFPLVLAHSFAIQRDGGDGARYVLLRKKDNNNE